MVCWDVTNMAPILSTVCRAIYSLSQWEFWHRLPWKQEPARRAETFTRTCWTYSSAVYHHPAQVLLARWDAVEFLNLLHLLFLAALLLGYHSTYNKLRERNITAALWPCNGSVGGQIRTNEFLALAQSQSSEQLAQISPRTVFCSVVACPSFPVTCELENFNWVWQRLKVTEKLKFGANRKRDPQWGQRWVPSTQGGTLGGATGPARQGWGHRRNWGFRPQDSILKKPHHLCAGKRWVSGAHCSILTTGEASPLLPVDTHTGLCSATLK